MVKDISFQGAETTHGFHIVWYLSFHCVCVHMCVCTCVCTCVYMCVRVCVRLILCFTYMNICAPYVPTEVSWQWIL